MSRIGRMPVDVPNGVQVDIKGSLVSVNGPKGKLERMFSPTISIVLENGQILITRSSDAPAERALHGTTRAVLNNMISGVSAGFQKVLEYEGVGYRAEMNAEKLVLHLGYSHPIEVDPPLGISFAVDAKTRQVFVRGFNKEEVGQTAANIRELRPPEPYHGKGMHYLGEKIRRKPGKSGKAK
ncbi:MAG: 50S ribosomal protein L6 [Chloroflexi bacterium GWB2_49_20]|nr:MAG: 50S ribosomal protein L6 [Chloroflexi bacterium GWB2_49_20]OGN76655.1 MAG: 50S ribosomal protein L6 [Chloroflexi bacterium GWC2_49_37]OGN83615.1 MAG: 50S ribosomal protein L6 [Chloroflexi bacterium GWD2_49_16]HBG74266.1 50S ribosomal protein L6 [Anaerolineae bacterium]HCC79471.1 50S ribosomal protein L6 [Anaerolineae bacterium]